MMYVLIVLAALVVLVRVCCATSKLFPSKWTGEWWQLAGTALGFGLELGSTIGLLFGISQAGYGLLIGIALLILCDRRRLPWECGR